MGFNSKYTGAQVEAWLDNIKNYSANDILEKLKTVDGSNSGLDADLLDGKQPSDLNVGSATQVMINYTYNQDINYPLVFTSRDNIGSAKNGGMYIDFYGRPTYNPKTDTLTVGNLSGNASSAIKLVSGTTNTLTASGVTLKDTYGRKVYDVGSEWFAFGSTDVVGMFQGYDLNFKCGAVTTMVIKNTTGNVGIGTTNPSTKLDVLGNIHTSGTLIQDSDIRLKNINKNVLLSLEDISNAPLFEFTYKSDENKRIHVGTSAQYWIEKNNWFCEKQDNGYYDMEIQNLALASAISIAKEFKKYKEETESTISSMKKEIEELKQIILNMNK